MNAIWIIWAHMRACARDLKAARTGDLDIYTRSGGQIFVGNEHREWRLR